MDLLILVVLVLTSGLLAGFYFAWWCSCMVGLREVSDAGFVESMQAINRSLPNARFAIPFFAPMILGAVATWLTFADGQLTAGWWSVAALVLSLITFGITAAGNVPLNNALEAAGRTDDTAARRAIERPWVRLNNLRTATSILAFAAAVAALVRLD